MPVCVSVLVSGVKTWCIKMNESHSKLDMGNLSQDQFYKLLKKKRDSGETLSDAQKQFLIEYAEKRLTEYFQEPEFKSVYDQLMTKF